MVNDNNADNHHRKILTFVYYGSIVNNRLKTNIFSPFHQVQTSEKLCKIYLSHSSTDRQQIICAY